MSDNTQQLRDREAFEAGYDKPMGNNPIAGIPQSADAHALGSHMRLHNWRKPNAVEKASGNIWRAIYDDGEDRFHVALTKVEGERYPTESRQAVPDGGGWNIGDVAVIESRLGGVFIVRLRQLVAPGVWSATIDLPQSAWHGHALTLHVSRLEPVPPTRACGGHLTHTL